MKHIEKNKRVKNRAQNSSKNLKSSSKKLKVLVNSLRLLGENRSKKELDLGPSKLKL